MWRTDLTPHPRLSLERSSHVADSIVRKLNHGVITIKVQKLGERTAKNGFQARAQHDFHITGH
jgi:hypothetical protein